MLRLLEKPKEVMQIAFFDTIGLFDSLWILMGMGFAYIMPVFD